jgi:hypothetical protein
MSTTSGDACLSLSGRARRRGEAGKAGRHRRLEPSSGWSKYYLSCWSYKYVQASPIAAGCRSQSIAVVFEFRRVPIVGPVPRGISESLPFFNLSQASLYSSPPSPSQPSPSDGDRRYRLAHARRDQSSCIAVDAAAPLSSKSSKTLSCQASRNSSSPWLLVLHQRKSLCDPLDRTVGRERDLCQRQPTAETQRVVQSGRAARGKGHGREGEQVQAAALGRRSSSQGLERRVWTDRGGDRTQRRRRVF